ncbi:amylo-alpha-1,6-glucosidase [Paenibacillus sp. DMB5]|uniref:amylo-alpha-1,6-glucosidase n=1 Tax=Paenibacillus sp. DMB5 TaxID=1780103 RepID=UPI00076C1D24|nr:amylo-alpha-1,6-glucosidase [Paenibacillus sp. DMB5]KUP24177.1 hypothetical protein AWJ19_11560 [Paenibacillus sp. DMB5]
MTVDNVPELLDQMKIRVSRENNRAVSFTNKEAAYYYTQSHLNDHPEHAYFEGMNVAKNRIFGGYTLYADGQELDNELAEVTVSPYSLVRTHGRLTEELWLFDYRNVLEVIVSGASTEIGISLKGEALEYLKLEGNTALFKAMEGEWIVALRPGKEQPLSEKDGVFLTMAAAGGFFIACARTAEEAVKLIEDTERQADALKGERVRRLAEFLQNNVYLSSSNEELTLALNWISLTMDQLVTRQQGEGIYAGLPWFNEYWGRDQFIAMPGAVLVSGQFETARQILLSFAEYQNRDAASKYYGRVPNILAPENIDYHTTDGTPRFIIQLQDYVKYSGDTALIEQLYPAVCSSIEGSLRYWVDEKGYLTHDDNETWMDARDAELKSYSPRDTRANDIQALWYGQLRAGVYFADYMQDQEKAERWGRVADRLQKNFAADFHDPAYPYLADRLDADGVPEFTLRPNQLFAFDLFDDRAFKDTAVRTAWEELVYPWGTASLDRRHPFFHPFHLTEQYHKDEAYHNGTVWTWLNGIAMQRMIEAGQEETAYELFSNMNRQALELGVVGGLSENQDAYPQEGASRAKLTGAYLQAWSNSEQLRVWYQYFLGIRPDLILGKVTLAPRMPQELTDVQVRVKAGEGSIEADYSSASGGEQVFVFCFAGVELAAIVDVSPFELLEIPVADGNELRIMLNGEKLMAELLDGNGQLAGQWSADISADRAAQQLQSDKIFDGVQFAEPLALSEHPVMERRSAAVDGKTVAVDAKTAAVDGKTEE